MIELCLTLYNSSSAFYDPVSPTMTQWAPLLGGFKQFRVSGLYKPRVKKWKPLLVLSFRSVTDKNHELTLLETSVDTVTETADWLKTWGAHVTPCSLISNFRRDAPPPSSGFYGSLRTFCTYRVNVMTSHTWVIESLRRCLTGWFADRRCWLFLDWPQTVCCLSVLVSACILR
jgi:hypothetical protein